MPAKYDVAWSGLDRGHDGQWVGPIWLPTFLVLSRHDGANYQDPDSPIYTELAGLIPTVSWKSRDASSPKGWRLYFRDAQEPWSSTGVVSFDDATGTISITESGKKLAAGTVSPSDVFVRAMESHVESGEKPFGILAAAFLDPAASQGLTFEQLIGGVMQNFRPGVDELSVVLASGNASSLGPTPTRRFRHMLTMLESVGAIAAKDTKYIAWNSGLLKRIAKSTTKSATTNSDLVSQFCTDCSNALLSITHDLALRFSAACASKRFLILTGLAGSGKTKVAQAFAHWITQETGWVDPGAPSKGKKSNPQYTLIPVGADWTGNENIVGYPDGLQSASYVTKPALELIRHALLPANATLPHFLILDEMNLSHVERYFADLLSAIESGEEILLYDGPVRKTDGRDVPSRFRLPENLFIIGTVNVDETTYMFSPKVLDRANVIEFRMVPSDLDAFLGSPKAPRLEELNGKGVGFAKEFVKTAADKSHAVPESVEAAYKEEMLLCFNLLREHNAEFGYRTAYEAARFVHFFKLLGNHSDNSSDWFKNAMDAVIVQKFLPKLHGSRSKLEGLLWALAWACGAARIERDGKNFTAQVREASQAQNEVKYGPEVVWNALRAKNIGDPAQGATYPLSFDKVMRMWRKLVRDQFVSFAEA
jgi:MoxR-like ATPase